MTFTPPSAALAALIRHGKHADVQLLARLGPSTALLVRSDRYQDGTTTSTTPTLLRGGEAFSFFCDELTRANKALSLTNEATVFARHLMRIIATDVPTDVYLLLAAIETRLLKVCEDIVNYMNSTDELAQTYVTYFQQSVQQDCWADLYGVDTDQLKKSDPCKLAEFVLGRCVVAGSKLVAFLTAYPVFSHNVNLYHINRINSLLHSETTKTGLQVSFLPAVVKRIALDQSEIDPEKEAVVRLTADAKKEAERIVNKDVPSVSAWVRAIEEDGDTVAEILAASRGDIKSFVDVKRARYVETLSPDEESKWRAEVSARRAEMEAQGRDIADKLDMMLKQKQSASLNAAVPDVNELEHIVPQMPRITLQEESKQHRVRARDPDDDIDDK